MVMVPDFTVVIGVDARHLRQLAMVWPTWVKNKPSTFNSERPLLIFFDRDQVTREAVCEVIGPHSALGVFPWPPYPDVVYEGGDDKWTNAQRYKMLAGYVHVPAMLCRTKYFLKIDVDCPAMGQDDWVDSTWFVDNPAIIASPWHYTKPPDQMMRLDAWSEGIPHFCKPPLNLVPESGANKVKHKRICSWCGFFRTDVARIISNWCSVRCGAFKLPVPSQDGLFWYFSTRMGLPIVRVQMKDRGWQLCSSDSGITHHAALAMQTGVLL
jgi:hypothetical protein